MAAPGIPALGGCRARRRPCSDGQPAPSAYPPPSASTCLTDCGGGLVRFLYGRELRTVPNSIPHPIPYQGSKRRLASAILRYVPRGANRMVEPFAGSAWGVSGIERTRMKRHDDSPRSDRLAVTQPVRPILPAGPPPPGSTSHNSLYDKQLTASADRPVRDPAHAVAFTTAVAVGGAGSVHRQNGMRTARALPGDRNRPRCPPATDCRRNPAPTLPAGRSDALLHRFTDHGPAWRCEAGPDVRRAVGACLMGRTRRPHLPSISGPRQTVSVGHLAGHPVPSERRCKMILKEPYARAA